MFPDLAELINLAEKSPRKRHTFSPKDANYPGCRYMINAILPGSYLQPHKHDGEGANELFIVLKGTVTSVFFSEAGEIAKAYDLNSNAETPLIEIPEKTFHTLLVRYMPSVILEVSRGPYVPERYKKFAPWAPAEDDERAREYLLSLEERAEQFIKSR